MQLINPEILAEFRAGARPWPPPLDGAPPAPGRAAAFEAALAPLGVDAGEARDVARLFPATDAAAVARWAALRSGISPEEQAAEPLFREEDDRIALFPLRDPEMWRVRKRMELAHWIADEADFEADAADFDRLSPELQGLVEGILGIFAFGDRLIINNLEDRVGAFLRTREGKGVLAFIEDQETVHDESYSAQAEGVLRGDAARRDRVFNSVRTMPSVARVADWFRWWGVGTQPAADVFASNAANEGVVFSGCFAGIQLFKDLNMLPGLVGLNELISRDEGNHCLFSVFVIAERLRRRPDPGVLQGIFREAARIGRGFFADVLPRDAPEVRSEELGAYVECQADFVLGRLGQPPVFGAANPFGFMEKLALNAVGKSNFFEHEVTQYQEKGARTFAVDLAGFDGEDSSDSE